MADIEITVDGGTTKRLLTAGKYCDKNILVTANGGGGGETGVKIVSGSFVPAEDVQFYTVQHNLGVIPKIMCFFSTNEDLFSMQNPAARFSIGADFFPSGKLLSAYKMSDNSLKRNSYYAFPDNNYFSDVTEYEMTIGSSRLTKSYWRLNSGEEYFWFVVG